MQPSVRLSRLSAGGGGATIGQLLDDRDVFFAERLGNKLLYLYR